MVKSKTKLIVLNGTSSSGKTTIAKKLQEMFYPEIYFYASIDTELFSFPLHRMSRAEYSAIVDNALIVMSKRTRACLDSGISVIVDTVFQDDQFEVFNEFNKYYSPIYIKVCCNLETLKSREAKRGDRRIGLAESQLEDLNLPLPYSLEIDTSINNTSSNCEQIIKIVRGSDFI